MEAPWTSKWWRAGWRPHKGPGRSLPCARNGGSYIAKKWSFFLINNPTNLTELVVVVFLNSARGNWRTTTIVLLILTPGYLRWPFPNISSMLSKSFWIKASGWWALPYIICWIAFFYIYIFQRTFFKSPVDAWKFIAWLKSTLWILHAAALLSLSYFTLKAFKFYCIGIVCLIHHLLCLMSSAFLSAVNQKKDSENTPVKGGTVADLGEYFTCDLLQA